MREYDFEEGRRRIEKLQAEYLAAIRKTDKQQEDLGNIFREIIEM